MRLAARASNDWIVRAVLSAAAVVGMGYLAIYWIGAALKPMRELGVSVECRRNVHMLARAFNLYADDYESRYPPTRVWEIAVGPYVQQRYRRCPALDERAAEAWGYAANADVCGVAREDVDRPEATALTYDTSRLVHSAADKVESLPKPGRHLTQGRDKTDRVRGNWVGYADGSARIALDRDTAR
jgi:hypothetical protein